MLLSPFGVVAAKKLCDVGVEVTQHVAGKWIRLEEIFFEFGTAVMRKSSEPPWALHFDGRPDEVQVRGSSNHRNFDVNAVPGTKRELIRNQNYSEYDDEEPVGGNEPERSGISQNKGHTRTSSVTASGEWKRPPSMAPRWAAGGVQELLVGSPTRGRKVYILAGQSSINDAWRRNSCPNNYVIAAKS